MTHLEYSVHILEHREGPTNVNFCSVSLSSYILTHLFAMALTAVFILCSFEKETEKLLDHEVLAVNPAARGC